MKLHTGTARSYDSGRIIVRVYVEEGTIQDSYDVHYFEGEVTPWPAYHVVYGNLSGSPVEATGARRVAVLAAAAEAVAAKGLIV